VDTLNLADGSSSPSHPPHEWVAILYQVRCSWSAAASVTPLESGLMSADAGGTSWRQRAQVLQDGKRHFERPFPHSCNLAVRSVSRKLPIAEHSGDCFWIPSVLYVYFGANDFHDGVNAGFHRGSYHFGDGSVHNPAGANDLHDGVNSGARSTRRRAPMTYHFGDGSASGIGKVARAAEPSSCRMLAANAKDVAPARRVPSPSRGPPVPPWATQAWRLCRSIVGLLLNELTANVFEAYPEAASKWKLLTPHRLASMRSSHQTEFKKIAAAADAISFAGSLR
jgi:hypothetical protein